MFKLVTGKPGDGKTSNELWEFLHAKEYKGRDKFCTPIKGFEAAKHGVTEIPVELAAQVKAAIKDQPGVK